MAFVENDGVRLWYEIKGEGEPIVLTGGFALLHDQWDRVTDILARDLKVINWHYRGSGHSDRASPGGFTLDRWVDDLEIILDHAGIEKAHFWGTSTGSFLTTRYAARYPQRVKSVITFPLFKASVAYRKAFHGFLYVVESFGYEALGKLLQWIGCADHNIFGGMSDEIAKFEAESSARNFSIESAAKIVDIFANCDLTSEVAKLTGPTMLLMGNSGQLAADSAGTSELVEIFKSQCPHVEIALIERGGGTYCMIEEPEESAAVVVEWVQRHE